MLIAIVEAILIVLLITVGHPGVRVVVKSEPVFVNPLEMALEYEAPNHIFEKLVKENPSWMKYRLELPDKTLAPPILANCAILNRTNYVRILIANGADVKIALNSLNKVGATGAIELIQQMESEIRSQSETKK